MMRQLLSRGRRYVKQNLKFRRWKNPPCHKSKHPSLQEDQLDKIRIFQRLPSHAHLLRSDEESLKRHEFDKLEFDAWPQITRFKHGKLHSQEKKLQALLRDRMVFLNCDQATSEHHFDNAESLFGNARMNFDTLDSPIAKSLMEIINSGFKRKMQVAKELQEKKRLPMLTVRQTSHIPDLRLDEV